MRFVCFAAASALAFSVSSPSFATTNLITNGDFSAGLTGYNTQYTGTDATGYQFLATNPHDVCGCFANLDGNTNGHGNQLVLDGAANGGYFFQQNLSIQANTWYSFSFDVANLGTAGPKPQIQLTINGTAFETTAPLDYSDQYVTYFEDWYSGATTNVTVELRDLTLDHSYNDFAIDNITFNGPSGLAAVPEPATWAMMLGGFGLIGAAARRRVRSSVRLA